MFEDMVAYICNKQEEHDIGTEDKFDSDNP